MLLVTARKIEHRGAHDLAHRMLAVAGQVLRYTIATGRCERDPTPDLRGALTVHTPKNQNAIKPEELPALLRAIGGGSRFILPGRNMDKPISNNTLLFALYRLGYKGKMTGHGFRAVASSALNEAGYRPDVIERQLAHKEPNKVRAAYNRTEYLPERRKMMRQWAGMADAYARGADVAPIKRVTA